MNLDKYDKELKDNLSEDLYNEVMELLDGDCEGCGGCCMNYNPFTWGMRNYSRGPCFNLSDDESDKLQLWKCDSYKERPEVCEDYDGKDDMSCHSMHDYFEEDAAETIRILYGKSDLSISERLKEVRETIELN